MKKKISALNDGDFEWKKMGVFLNLIQIYGLYGASHSNTNNSLV